MSRQQGRPDLTGPQPALGPMTYAERPPWQQNALCLGMNPNLWFPGQGETSAPAIVVCNVCPVQDDCLTYALDHPDDTTFGIWGGKGVRERRAMMRGRPVRRAA